MGVEFGEESRAACRLPKRASCPLERWLFAGGRAGVISIAVASSNVSRAVQGLVLLFRGRLPVGFWPLILLRRKIVRA